MITWIKSKLIWIVGILLIISLIVNFWFIAGKGITVNRNNYSTSSSISYANASSSSIGININGGSYYGNNQTVYDLKQFSSLDEAMVFLNGQDEGSLYNKEIIIDDKKIYVLYRMVTKYETKKEVTKKTINGVEVAQ